MAASTIQRYEAGTIDNTKKLVLDGLSEALHVSVEWLKGETDEYETDNTDKRELIIRDAMGNILDYVRAFTAVLQQSFRFAVFPKQYITFNSIPCSM